MPETGHGRCGKQAYKDQDNRVGLDGDKDGQKKTGPAELYAGKVNDRLSAIGQGQHEQEQEIETVDDEHPAYEQGRSQAGGDDQEDRDQQTGKGCTKVLTRGNDQAQGCCADDLDSRVCPVQD